MTKPKDAKVENIKIRERLDEGRVCVRVGQGKKVGSEQWTRQILNQNVQAYQDV